VTSDRILALDVGTQSVRALAFDGAGTLVAGARVPIEPYVAPRPGWAEQDPEIYWRAAEEACGRLWASGFDRASVAALALTTQRGTVVVTDLDGRPLRPAIVWLDQRRTVGLPPVGGLNGFAFRALGVMDTIAAFQADAESNWIRVNEPEVWARIGRYLLLSGYLARRMTGRFVDSAAAQIGYLPFDFRRSRWAARRDWKWAVCDVDAAWLPELVQPGERLGELTDEAAAALGLPPGLPVIATAGDKACEVLGSGALDPAIGALSLGTTATFNTTQRRYVEPIRYVPAYPSAVAGAWTLETMVYRGFWMIEWFLREFGHPEAARAAAEGSPAEALLDELLAQAPPGSMGLTVQPYWSPGLRFPGPEAKGAMIGFGSVHTRAHVYRAILEGIAYALRDGAERTERRTGTAITELRASGGGARSPAVVRLIADVFGLPTGVPHTHETSGLGAAIAGAVAIGLHPDADTAVRSMTRLAALVEPDPATHATYERLYRQVYRPMYGRLRPLYDAIRTITGYPAA
jgi:sugar (pentulose or hexulose) kinase